MRIISNLIHQGVHLSCCMCSCGQKFHAREDDIKFGEVSSCGHSRAGNILDRFVILPELVFTKKQPKLPNDLS